MNLELLKANSQKIEKEIHSLEQENPDIFPISDGIINFSKYLEAKFKILWILKEANDVVDGQGGGWYLNKSINSGKSWAEKNRTGKTTFKRMIYTSYSILNGFPLWKDIPEISTNHTVWETIKKIALINVKKLPGSDSSYDVTIKRAYTKNKDLLFKQIDTYNPDIIIGGNTLGYFIKDLNFDKETRKIKGSVHYYFDKDKLYIDAYHPNVRPKTILEEDYCNEIIFAAKDWIQNKKT